MKKLYAPFAFLLILSSLFLNQAWKPAPATGPKIVFTSRVFDFGTIKRHADGTCWFEFKNDGDEPLLITKVTASCGCTAPTWPKAPVLPGQTEKIKVVYNTKTVGNFTKTISISCNDPQSPTVVITIKGTVTRS